MAENKKQFDEISKFLSYVLRHEPHAIGLELDTEGWANIDTLILGANKHGRVLDKETLLAIVSTNDKKRFSISEDGHRIRAVQGHSTSSVKREFVETPPPEFLYHGTATRFIASILEQGIKAGSRHHVHLSQDMATAIAVGQRHGKPAVLKIDAKKMHQKGFRFFLSENNVWLIDYVPPDFISN